MDRRPLRLFGGAALAIVVTAWPCLGLAETPGKDGPIAVGSSGTVLNEYGVVSGTLSAGATSVTVSGLAAALPTLEAGDLFMLYQAQGATISGSDTASYGEILSYNGAGRYEFQTVDSIAGDTITLRTYGSSCGGLTYSYDPGDVQIIRVPQATTLSVPSGTSITAPAWNGSTGGVVALHVRDTLSLSGDITASEAGFRGGVVDNLTTPSNRLTGPTGYVSTLPAQGAEKGESIAGANTTYPGGRFQRGAAANGGGGGNGHNAGGGGGANGNSGLAWNGQGNPDLSGTNWNLAWDIDGTLTSTTTSSGGGRGGYTYARAGDAFTLPPGSWGNDGRREVGGLGGRPLAFDASGRVFLGGGGGAGDGNNNAAGAGGRGGGLVFIIADTVTGSGRVLADGQDGEDTSPSHNDAPGGGGGGGTIIIKADILSGVSARANGGDGGDQFITSSENEGPGGGGGGGVIAVSGGLPASSGASGGVNGITTSPSLSEFIPNGATQGGAGQPNEAAPTDAALPFCAIPPGQVTAVKSVAPWDGPGSNGYMTPGSDVVYSFAIENIGYQPIATGTIDLRDSLPPEVIFYNGEFDPDSPPVTGPFSFEDVTGPSGLTCCTTSGETAFASSPGALVPTFGYTPGAGYDDDVSHFRVTPTGEMAPQTSVLIRFRAQIK